MARLRADTNKPGRLPLWLSTLVVVGACEPSPAPPLAPAAPVASAAPAPDHHHELHLPPVGPSVRVTLDGKSTDVALGTLPVAHEGTAPLLALFHAASPAEDAAPLHFDLIGSDGFHPASRPPCARLLTGAEIAAARIDVVSHDVSFDSTVQLPGCYRVKAVVALDASR